MKRRKRRQRPARILAHGALTGLRTVSRLLLLLPIPLFMIWLNYTVDVSALFKGEVDEYNLAIVEAQRAGAAIDYNAVDERALLATFAETLEAPFDTLIFGSSRVLQLRATDISESGSVYNCGLSGGDLVDLLGCFYLFDRAEMLPKNIMIGVDTWLLGDEGYRYSPRSNVALFNEFLSTRLGITTDYSPPTVDYEKYSALLTPTYFQGNVQEALSQKESTQTADGISLPLVTPQTDVTDINTKLPDGSVVYCTSFKNVSQEEVNLRALQNYAGYTYLPGDLTKIDKSKLALFEAFLQYAQAKGVNVVLFMTPYHPAYYNFVLENPAKCGMMLQTEQTMVALGQKYQLPVYGSFSPFIADFTQADFYDEHHAKQSALKRLLPTIEEIITAQAEGTAGSPWLNGRAAVTYEVAQRLMAERYVVDDATEALRQEADKDINGSPCYVASRIRNGANIAQYAVDQTNGMIYRFVPAAKEWVVDYRYPGEQTQA